MHATMSLMWFESRLQHLSFMSFQQVQRELGLDYAFANTLEVDETTGERCRMSECLAPCSEHVLVSQKKQQCKNK